MPSVVVVEDAKTIALIAAILLSNDWYVIEDKQLQQTALEIAMGLYSKAITMRDSPQWYGPNPK
jgi:hypothetical protein